jgi:hypothetical protein
MALCGMRLIHMATIASPLLQRRKEPDEEQLLKLFWNRAELKKELGKLRQEKEKLIDQIRQQEGINLRSQQRLEQLENLLADPLQAVNAIVYYQLRGVWQQSRKRLMRLARDLVDRQQDREDQHARARFEQVRDGELAAIDEKIADIESRARVLENDLHTAQERRRQLRGFWNYFRRRAGVDKAEAIQASLEGLRSQITRLIAARQEKEAEPCPAFAGLSVEGKRNINLAIVALAQQLLVHFAEHNVAGLAREAAVRSLADVTYGSAVECRTLGQNVEGVVRRLDAVDKLMPQGRRRAEFLRLTAQYRRDSDTVPVAGSFATLPVVISEAGELRPADDRVIPVNVLADEYWDIYNVLLS